MTVLFVTALDTEAKPLVKTLGLKRDHSEHVYPIFTNENHQLIVSGIGKARAAAAVAYLGARQSPDRQNIWLNIGIAGHKTLAPGRLIVAHRILDEATGKSWYPSLHLLSGIASDALTTVDRPEVQYLDDCAYDMEAAGFYPIATRFDSGELVQCLKIVSDNPENPAAKIRKSDITELIANSLPQVLAVMEQLSSALHDSHNTVIDLTLITSRLRLSVTQTHEVRKLARVWAAHGKSQRLLLDIAINNPSAAKFLVELKKEIRNDTGFC